MSRRRPRGIAITAAIVLLSTGCGVIRVDVDVYRGPLANHEEVQAQQFAAMAIGVKPILVQLRDHLMWGADKPAQCTGVHDLPIVAPPASGELGASTAKSALGGVIGCRAEMKKICETNKALCWYGDGQSFIPTERLPGLVHDHVRQVNLILALYEDRGAGSLRPFVGVLENGRARIERAAATFRLDPGRDEAFWRRAESAFFKTDDLRTLRTHLALSPTLSDANVRELGKKIETLRAEFREFVVGAREKEPGRGPRRNVSGIRAAADALTAFIDTLADQARAPKSQQLLGQRVFEWTPISEPSTEDTFTYRWLTDLQEVQRSAALFFANPKGAAATEWTQRVVDLARATAELPSGLRDIWVASLETMPRIASAASAPRNGQREEATWILPTLAEIGGKLIQPRNLAIALALKTHAPTDAVEQRDALKKALVRFSSDQTWEADWEWTDERYRTAARAVELVLLAAPQQWAPVLLAVDAAYRQTETGEITSKDATVNLRYGQKESRRFGLVRTLRAEDDQKTLLDWFHDLATLLTKVARVVAAHALDKGRRDPGIENLLEVYLKASTPLYGAPAELQRKRENEVRAAREELNVALIHFSEKVLLLANNDVLLKPDEDRETVGPELLKILKGAEVNRYVLVLQAVGNAIQIYADELAHRASYTSRLERRTEAEADALQRAFTRTARDAYERLVKDLQTETVQARARQAEAEKRHKDAGARVPTSKDAHDAAVNEERQAAAAIAPLETALDAPFIALRRSYAATRVLGVVGVALPADVKAKLPEGQEPAADVTKDANDFATAVRAATPAPTDGPKLVAQAIAWLKRPVNAFAFACDVGGQPSARPLTPRGLRLGCAHAYFAAPPDRLKQITTTSADDVFVQARRIAESEYQADLLSLHAAQAKVDETKTAHKKAAAAAKNAEEAHKQAQNDVVSAKSALDTASAAVERFAAAEAAVQGHRAAVTEAAEGASGTDGGRPLYAALLALLDKDIADAKRVEAAAAANSNEQKAAAALRQRLERARLVVVERWPLAAAGMDATTIRPPRATVGRTQRDVLDDLIATLRYEHVRAASEGGAESGRAKNIADALRLAHEQRAGMAYIRPSGAYLRSSYAVTDLQDDPRLRWTNLLWEHGKRSIPFLGDYLTNLDYNAAEKKRLEVITHIDKQFWQGINRVRLAGGGNTNYALAKDDIGNWYVKAFSADPEPIIRAAQRLALFNAGMAGDLNLLRRLDLQQQLTRDPDDRDARAQLEALRTDPQPARGGGPGLQRVLDRYRREYAEATARDVTALRARLADGLVQTRIRDAWAARVSFPDDATGAQKEAFLKRLGDLVTADVVAFLDGAAKELADVAGAPPADEPLLAVLKRAEGQAAALLTALGSIKRFHDSLLTRIIRLDVTVTTLALRERESELRTKEDAATRARNDHKLKQDEIDGATRRNEDTGELRRQEEALRQRVTEATTAVDDARKAVERARQADEANPRNRDAAASEVVRAGRGLLLDFAERRRAAIETLERSVVFIGDASRQ